MHHIKATLTAPTTKTAEMPSTPLVRSYTVVGTVKGELKEIASLNLYQGSGLTVRACFWMQYGEYRSGRGSAGGGGYCKFSAAAADAISNAGIQLWGSAYNNHKTVSFKHPAHISGVGEQAIEAALIAIAKLVTPRGKLLVVRS
jgi:hypothetical protein